MAEWQDQKDYWTDKYNGGKTFLDQFDVGSGPASDAWNWLTGSRDKKEAADRLNAQMGMDRGQLDVGMRGMSPFVDPRGGQAGNYDQLIAMLGNRAAGNGPSLAGDAYANAAQNSLSQQFALSHGANPGAARMATQNMGNIQQGLANGYATARNQEMIGAGNQLGNVIQGADNSQLMRDKANQDAWLKMLSEKLGLTRAQIGAQQQGGNNNMQNLGPIIQAIAAM